MLLSLCGLNVRRADYHNNLIEAINKRNSFKSFGNTDPRDIFRALSITKMELFAKLKAFFKNLKIQKNKPINNEKHTQGNSSSGFRW